MKDKGKEKIKATSEDVFAAFAQVLGFAAPELDPGSGFKVIKGAIENWDLEITCSQNNQATQTTITITNPPQTELEFEILGGVWKDKNCIETQNTTFDTAVCCKSKQDAMLLELIGSQSIRLSIQALVDCCFQLTKDQFQFTENLDFSQDLFPKYMNVVSVMVRIATFLSTPRSGEIKAKS